MLIGILFYENVMVGSIAIFCERKSPTHTFKMAERREREKKYIHVYFLGEIRGTDPKLEAQTLTDFSDEREVQILIFKPLQFR